LEKKYNLHTKTQSDGEPVIVSNKHKFIFSRSTKVGGKSAQAMILRSGMLGDGDFHCGEAYKMSEGSIDDMTLPETFIKTIDASYIKAGVILSHAKPDDLIANGIASKSEVSDYTFVTMIRNPIERYISAWVYEGGKDITILKSRIKNSNSPMSILFSKPEDHLMIDGVRAKRFCAIDCGDLENGVRAFIQGVGGEFNGSINIGSGNYPKEVKGHYSEFLTQGEISSLRKALSDEISFYTEVTGVRV